jgi:hypothetical protein
MCLWFAGLCALAGAVLVAGLTGVAFDPVVCVLCSVPFGAFAVWALVSLLRGLKTLVREFSYDGRLLRFRTIGQTREQVRALSELAEVREGQASRGQAIGYCLAFRDGQKVYLDYWLQNAPVLVEQLRLDLQRLP